MTVVQTDVTDVFWSNRSFPSSTTVYYYGSTVALNADMIEGPYDTGGCNYRSPDTKETCYSKDCDVDEIDKKVIIVPCLALNGVATNSSCVSLVDPEQPGLIFGDSGLRFQR